jgi:hypothetical protein
MNDEEIKEYANKTLKKLQIDLMEKYNLQLKYEGLVEVPNMNEYSEISINECLIKAYKFICLNDLIILQKTEKSNSYGLKHLIEELIGTYISNGQCILLMKMKDEKIKIYPEKYTFARMNLNKQLSNYSINCGFNVKINKKILTKNHLK